MNNIFTQHIFHAQKEYSLTLAAKIASRMPASVEVNSQLIGKEKNESLADYYNRKFTERFSTKNDVLVLPIIGEMSRYSYWSFGNEFLAKLIENAEANENYKGIVLLMDTGGGTADSCNLLADAVASCNKPVVVQTNFCCSAGMFIASQANEISVEQQAATQVGSLGTIIMYQNFIGYLQKQGIEVEIIRAAASKDKETINPYEEFTEEMRAELVERANVACKEFHGYVKRGRAGKITSEEVFTGKTYNVKDAIRLGLADRTGTLKDSINRVIQLSKQ